MTRNSVTKEITAKEVLVTPDLAREMLTHNKVNRPLIEKWIKKYARDMQAGKWERSGQGIIFDEDGLLVDGQNRLTALIRTGLSLRMLVIRNVQRGCYHMDTGRCRSEVDNIKIHYPDLKWITRNTLSVVNTINYSFNVAETLDEKAEYLHEHVSAMEWVHQHFRVNNAAGLTSSGFRAALALAYENGVDERILLDFCNLFKTDDFTSEDPNREKQIRRLKIFMQSEFLRFNSGGNGSHKRFYITASVLNKLAKGLPLEEDLDKEAEYPFPFKVTDMNGDPVYVPEDAKHAVVIDMHLA